MAVRTVENRGFLGLKKHREKVAPGEEFSLIRPIGVIKNACVNRTGDIETVSVYDDGDNRRNNSSIRYYPEEWINNAKLIVLGKHGKPARLEWKKD